MSNLRVSAKLSSFNNKRAVFEFFTEEENGSKKKKTRKHMVRVWRGSTVFARLQKFSPKVGSGLQIEVLVGMPVDCPRPIYTVVGL